MRYTSHQINQMTWAEWNATMAKELNKAGFKARGFNSKTRKWEDNLQPYTTTQSEPKFFILGTINSTKEIDYLKQIGLLNNGRCPMCGSPINNNPGRFTSGYDNNLHFQICQSCYNKGRKTSMNPANNNGCILTLILFPWQIIKSLF